MVKIYAATSNPGKLRDFSVAGDDLSLAIEPMPGLNAIQAPEEDQPSFAGNAQLKAAYYSRLAAERGEAVLVLADDSGLEVDALGGQPGVRSARFAQDAGFLPEGAALTVDQRNNLYLLERMRDAEQRAGRYHCVLAVARAGEVLATAEGSVEGQILRFPRGTGGFGYDPLFWLPELGRTMAEVSLEEKHTLSHRGRAFRALLPQLRALVAG